MTALGKRTRVETVTALNHKEDSDDGASAVVLAKRPRCDVPDSGAAGIVAGDVWNGILCDEEDMGACRDIVESVKAGRSLITVLDEAYVYHIDLAVIQLFDDCEALDRLCRAIAPSLPPPCAATAANSQPDKPAYTITVDALLCRAAQQGRRDALAILMRRLAGEYDVARAIEMADEEDDPAAVELIVETHEDNAGEDPSGSCRRIAYAALTCAASSSRIALIHRFADKCDVDSVHELLDDHHGNGEVFAALWEHSVLCAHAYSASLSPCPALDHLAMQIANGEPCADMCASYDDADSDDDDKDGVDDEDSKDGGEDDDETDDDTDRESDKQPR
ncbi:hypothetical protein pdul_cds_531 [Pandoravirus dulcis]|uniref:Uncharacterized protein n=1 Tax=Pandoravirus dulcis TaxID=1349409 RepID=S4VT91_9VIRU|nr:hypothetical protein pdul_cds_531 [Pandoravirus dulcis]AGO82630.1 hypothetical protein pdul_cds_531 [Pandoravirus dulcis]